jgi:hypothetical protein
MRATLLPSRATSPPNTTPAAGALRIAGVLCAPALGILLDLLIFSFRRHLAPQQAEILQELEERQEIRAAASKILAGKRGREAGSSAAPTAEIEVHAV